MGSTGVMTNDLAEGQGAGLAFGSDAVADGSRVLATEAILRELEKVLHSLPFVRSKQLGKFLRYVVTERLAGRAENVSGYAIAFDVLGRGDSFDPAINPIVRSEARRLCQKLDEYYRTEGQADPIVISLEKGTYVPTFSQRGLSSTDELIGKAFSSFLILEKIGQGRMGTVYKAEDTRLHRLVALKVFPKVAGRSGNTVQVSRDVQAAVLDHPNICTVYEASETESHSYIASAYIPGESLENKLRGGPLGVLEVLEFGREIAEGLAAAHIHGIVHGDLNPRNVLIADSGPELARVKIIDFGLSRVKGTTGAVESSEQFGTLAYMSPEQAMGRAVDGRTDIWALGVILYEAMSGKLPFDGENAAMTRLVILESAPAPVEVPGSRIPPQFQRIVLKCLEKDPGNRYQSAEDLLSELRGLTNKSKSGDGTKTASWRKPVLKAAAMAVICFASTGLMLLLNHAWDPRDQPRGRWEQPEILTSYPGEEIEPTLSPDGSIVAFARRRDSEDQFDLWVKVIGEENPIRITSHWMDDCCPSWSPDGGYIAFLRVSPQRTADLILTPALGGTERVLAVVARGPFTRPSWSPDGEFIAIGEGPSSGDMGGLTLVSTRTSAKQRIVNYEFLKSPIFSSDGQRIAFFATDALCVIGADGTGRRRLTTYRDTSAGTTLSPDGRHILYGAEGRLWTVPFKGGPPTPVGASLANVKHVAVSQSTGDLVYSEGHVRMDTWLVDLKNGAGRPPQRLLDSYRRDNGARFSPDGRRIAFHSNRSGRGEIWTAKVDGSGLKRLTDVESAGPPHWSPDGSEIVLSAHTDDGYDVYAVASDGGIPRRITNSAQNEMVPSFSPDGRWIYFGSNRSGSRQIWKIQAEGEEARPNPAIQVTQGGGVSPVVSPDGKFVYYAKHIGNEQTDSPYSIWRGWVEEGLEEVVVERFYSRPGGFTPEEDGLYFINRPDGPSDATDDWAIYRLDYNDRTVSRIFELPQQSDPVYRSLDISPDGRWALLATREPSESNLMFIKNAFPSLD